MTPEDSSTDRFALPPLRGVDEADDPAPEAPLDQAAPPIPPLEDEYVPAQPAADDAADNEAADDEAADDEDADDEDADEPAPIVETEPEFAELEDQAAYFAGDFDDTPALPPPPPLPSSGSRLTGVAAAVTAVEALSARPSSSLTPRDKVDEADDVELTAAAQGSADDDEDDLPAFLRPGAVEEAFGIKADDNEQMSYTEPETHLTAPLAEMPEVAPEKKSSKPTVARTLAEIPILLVVAALIAFLVKTFLAQAYYIPSGSMLPQLQIDDRVVVSKLSYKLHDPRRGDIVVFDDPRPNAPTADDDSRTGFQKWIRQVGEGVGVVQPSTDEFIKRVIGLPGDRVSAHDGSVFINGKKLLEPYLPAGSQTSDFPAVTVSPGRLWVMGDNRGGSADSRIFGQIKIDEIVGRAMVRVWPFSHISFL